MSESQAEREISCPLCGYETIVWDSETHWCHECLGGRRPAAEALLKPLAMRRTETPPLIEVVRTMFHRLRNAGFGTESSDLQIYAGVDVAGEIHAEFRGQSRVNPHSGLAEAQPMIEGVGVATAQRLDDNELRVVDEHGYSRGSQYALQSVHIPWQVLEDG